MSGTTVGDEDGPSSSSSGGLVPRQTDPESTQRLNRAMIAPPASAERDSPIWFVLCLEDVDRPVNMLFDCDALYEHWLEDLHYVVRPPIHHAVAD